MRKTVKVEDVQREFEEYCDLMMARREAAYRARESIQGIDPETYTAIVLQGAFAMLKSVRKLAGHDV